MGSTRGPTAAGSPRPDSGEAATVRTILVVEDNAVARALVGATLAGEGYAVLEAPDGRTALELAAGSTPDLVLLDQVLPDTDGLALAAALRARPGWADVPILGVSAFLSRAEAARGVAAFTDVLAKPLEPARLLRAVASWLPPREVPDAPPGLGRHVLVVDDDPVQFRLARACLAGQGFRVTAAPGGAEALAQARRAPPDAILSDVLMPGMDGFELCLAVRRDPALGGVPVVLTSSYFVEEADRELARKAGASALVARTPDLSAESHVVLASLRTPAPAAPAEAAALDRDHLLRVLHHLQRQVARNVHLVHESSTQAARLSALTGLAEHLASGPDPEPTLDRLLGVFLDAVGVSRGALWVADGEGRLALAAACGWEAATATRLGDLCGCPDLLARGHEARGPLAIPSAAVPAGAGSTLLAGTGARFAALVPLARGEERLGVLLAASTARDLTDADWLAFAQLTATRLGLMHALGRTLRRLSESERRLRELNATLEARVAARTGELREANQALEAFAYSVSHDLRAPLRAIQGFSQILVEDSGDRLDAESLGHLTRIAGAAGRMDALIQDLLAYSRVSRTDLHLRPVALDGVVAAALAQVKGAAEEAGADVAVDGPLPIVMASGSALVQVVTNLLSNAVKFVAPGVRPRVRVGADRDEGRVRLWVEDNGVGVAPEHQARIFHVFERLHGLETYPGTGIGLAIVQKAVERMGGQVGIDSAPGRGSRFWLSLPPA